MCGESICDASECRQEDGFFCDGRKTESAVVKECGRSSLGDVLEAISASEKTSETSKNNKNP